MKNIILKTKNYIFKTSLLAIIWCSFTVAKAQIVLENEVLISNSGLHFGGSKTTGSAANTGENAPYDFFFGKSISAHGDCIKAYGKYVFMTWYRGGKADRHVMLSRYNTETGSVATIEFPHRHTGFQNRWWIGESHNTIGLGVSPVDGTIHMVYDMHAYSRTKPSNGSLSNDYFRYSHSVKNAASVPDSQFTLSQFVQNANGGYKHLSLNGGEDYSNFQGLTYPQFFLNDAGDLFMYIREGGNNNGAYKFSKYTASTSTWSDFTSFNVLHAKRRQGITHNWGLYGNMKYVNGKIRVGFQRRSSNNNDKFQYQNGVYYAYSDNQEGTDNWKSHTGEGFSLPLLDANKALVFEPGNLVETTKKDKVHIVGDFDWTVTNKGDIHIISRVSDKENGVTKSVHSYKPIDSLGFTTTEEFKGSSDIYTYEDDIYIIGLNDSDRVFVDKAKGGTNNFRRVYEATSGKRFDHGAVYIANGKLYYYLMEIGSGSALPLYLQTINLNLNAAPEPLVANITAPLNGEPVKINRETLITADAYTDNGKVTRVDFKVNGKVIKSDLVAPFNANWIPTTSNQYDLEVVAYSDSNEQVTSSVVTVNVEEQDPSDLSGDIYRLKNLATGMYLDSENSEIIASNSSEGVDKEWEFVKVNDGIYYNIDSKSSRGILRFTGGTAGTMINTGFSAPRPDSDKMWSIIYDEVSNTFSFKTRIGSRYLYHNTDNSIIHSTKTDDRSKWIAESTSAAVVLSTNDEKLRPNAVSIYPNPAKDEFTIKMNGLGKTNIAISNILGKLIYTANTKENAIRIPTLGTFKTGLYLIKITGANQQVYYQKLVIE